MTTEVFPNDILNRKKTAEFLTNYIISECEDKVSRENHSFVLNLNGGWGVGKSYFINNWAEMLKQDNHPVVLFNAWKYDYSDQPLMSFFAEVNEQLEKTLPKRGKAKIKLLKLFQKGKNILTKSLPAAVKHIAIRQLSEEAIDAIDDDDPNHDNALPDTENPQLASLLNKAVTEALKNHNKSKRAIEDFNDNFTKFTKYLATLKSAKLPIFIFIDELDRCRPTFAVELLENIKHIFNIPNVCFVVATHTQQLQHSISAIYGDGFDAEIYLHRFFDSEFVLPVPNNFDFSKLLFERSPLEREVFSPLDSRQCVTENSVIEIFALVSGFYGLSLRDQEQCYKQARALILVWPEETIHFAFLIFLIMLKKIDRKLFNETREFGWGTTRVGFSSLENEGTPINLNNTFEVYNIRTRPSRGGKMESKVSEIFQIYLKNQCVSDEILSKLSRSDPSWKARIGSEIYDAKSKERTQNAVIKSDLRKYFDIVDQMGFLS
ncbi:MAG: hypothetical protein COB54_03870 [Alphaproteobacteria bacterium]|nr:MAG: hypothetical protein COB54_03870 [Alphaproteobacteria bacterium]